MRSLMLAVQARRPQVLVVWGWETGARLGLGVMVMRPGRLTWCTYSDTIHPRHHFPHWPPGSEPKRAKWIWRDFLHTANLSYTRARNLNLFSTSDILFVDLNKMLLWIFLKIFQSKETLSVVKLLVYRPTCSWSVEYENHKISKISSDPIMK